MIIRDFSERSCPDKKEMALAEFQQTRLESWNADDNENEKKALSYQRHILKKVKSMLMSDNYCILNLDTGLGKTFIALSLLCECRALLTNDKIPALVIAPARNLKDPWEKEIKQFNSSESSGIKHYVYHGINKDVLLSQDGLQFAGFDIVLTSYQTLTLKNSNTYFKNTFFPLIIFDEPQKIINPMRLRKTLKDISGLKSKKRLALTASPLSNSITELYALESFIKDPSMIELAYEFISQNKNDLEILEMKCRDFSQIISASKFEQKISDEIKLPKLKEFRLVLPISPSIQERLETLSSYPQQSKLLSNSGLFIKSDNNPFFNSREKVLDIILSKIPEDEKVIVFSMYTEGLDSLFAKLSRDYVCFKNNGTMQQKQKETNVKFFKLYSRKAIMLASVKANETGLNYQEANNVIFMDAWYNPQVMKQARDRCFRMGQKKAVNVFYLSTNTDFENNIWNIEKEKLNITQRILDRDEGGVPVEYDFSNGSNKMERFLWVLD